MAYLFKVFTNPDSELPFVPAAPFYLGGFILVVATYVSFTLDLKKDM